MGAYRGAGRVISVKHPVNPSFQFAVDIVEKRSTAFVCSTMVFQGSAKPVGHLNRSVFLMPSDL